MWRGVLLLVAIAACGDNAIDGEDAGDDIGSAELRARTVSTLAPEGVGALALATLDERRFAIARVDTSGTAFCPDCVGLDPGQCPDVCTRSIVSVSVHDAGGAVGAPTPIATVFLPTSDVDVAWVDVVRLGVDRVGVAWLECDNSPCMGLFQKQSCTARYAIVDLTSQTIGATRMLYQQWFGDLQLAFDPQSRRLLAVVGKPEAFGVGVRRAVFDESGGELLLPWATLGSFAARTPAAIARGGHFVVVVDDRSPSQPAPDPPCAASCDCLAAGGAEVDAGGMFAFSVGDGPDVATRVATGRGDGGLYESRERIAVIDAGGRLMIADTQSIDRAAEIFVEEGSSWTNPLRSQAPIPLWIGALGNRDAVAWIGSEIEPGQTATVQRLVGALRVGSRDVRATFTEPLDRNVFATSPVETPEGVSRTLLLQGVLRRIGAMVVFDRFEVVEVEMLVR